MGQMRKIIDILEQGTGPGRDGYTKVPNF